MMELRSQHQKFFSENISCFRNNFLNILKLLGENIIDLRQLSFATDIRSLCVFVLHICTYTKASNIAGREFANSSSACGVFIFNVFTVRRYLYAEQN